MALASASASDPPELVPDALLLAKDFVLANKLTEASYQQQ